MINLIHIYFFTSLFPNLSIFYTSFMFWTFMFICSFILQPITIHHLPLLLILICHSILFHILSVSFSQILHSKSHLLSFYNTHLNLIISSFSIIHSYYLMSEPSTLNHLSLLLLLNSMPSHQMKTIQSFSSHLYT